MHSPDPAAARGDGEGLSGIRLIRFVLFSEDARAVWAETAERG